MNIKRYFALILFFLASVFFFSDYQQHFNSNNLKSPSRTQTPLIPTLTKTEKQDTNRTVLPVNLQQAENEESKVSKNCLKKLEANPAFSAARQKIWSKLPEYDFWFYKNESDNSEKPSVLTNGSLFFRVLSMAGLLDNGREPENLEQAKIILTNLAEGEPENSAIFLALAIVYEKLGQPSDAVLDRIKHTTIFYTYYGMAYQTIYKNVESPEELVAAVSVAENLTEIDWSQFLELAQRHNLQILVKQILNQYSETLTQKNTVALHWQDYEFATQLNSKSEQPLDLSDKNFRLLIPPKSSLINDFLQSNKLNCSFESVAKLIPEFKSNIQPVRFKVHKINSFSGNQKK